MQKKQICVNNQFIIYLNNIGSTTVDQFGSVLSLKSVDF